MKISDAFRGKFFGLILPMVFVAVGLGAIYLAWRTSNLTEELARQTRGSKQTMADVQEQLNQLTQQHQELSTAHGEAEQQRDKLLAQVKRMREQTDRYELALAERDHLEVALQHASVEMQQTRDELSGARQQLEALQQLQDQFGQERQRLTEALDQSRKRTREKALQETNQQLERDVAAQKWAEKELRRVVASAQRELREVDRRETVLAKRLQKLQQDYTVAVAENSQLRRERRAIPQDVTRMAKQHERLVQETADMHYNLGVLFSKNKQYHLALVEFQKVMEMKPNDPDAMYNLGVIYADHVPDRAKAIQVFRRYLELNPDASDASWVKQYIASWQAWEGEERLE